MRNDSFNPQEDYVLAYAVCIVIPLAAFVFPAALHPESDAVWDLWGLLPIVMRNVVLDLNSLWGNLLSVLDEEIGKRVVRVLAFRKFETGLAVVVSTASKGEDGRFPRPVLTLRLR